MWSHRRDTLREMAVCSSRWLSAELSSLITYQRCTPGVGHVGAHRVKAPRGREGKKEGATKGRRCYRRVTVLTAPATPHNCSHKVT